MSGNRFSRKLFPDTSIDRLPIYACAAFILFFFLANIWNVAVERDWPKLRIRSASPLAGVSRPKPTPWTLETFLNGETQKAVSINLGRLSPIFPISVRAKNQFIYSLFGVSAAPGVVIGRHGQLFEQFYIDEYCRRDGRADGARLSAWAREISEIQASVARAGKSFVYVISPSKAARYPEDLPLSAPCAARASDMSEKLPPYLAALGNAQVRFVDGANLIAARRTNYPVPLFPRGGTHWNSLAAGLTLKEIMRVAPSPLGALDFSWRLAAEPVGTDRDLTDLMNLLRPDLDYPTTEIASTNPPGVCAHPPRLLAMGGSFVHQLLAAAMLSSCPPQVDYWFFMRTEENEVELGHFRRPPGETGNGERLPVDPDALDDNLRNADLVLLEENETNLSTMKQVGLLRAAVGRVWP
jgi:alginate O-acetyltransferase complex protein AlgJ